jgi:hypothetical protein
VFSYQGGGATAKEGYRINGPFNELQYFVNVTSFSSRAFQNSLLTEITLPPRITAISNYCLSGTNNLVKCNLHEGITSIGTYGLCSTSIPVIIIPSTVTSVGAYGLSQDQSKQEVVVFLSTTPPTLAADSVFGSTNTARNRVTIYVPDESLEAYKSAQYFSVVASRIHPMSDFPT